MLFNLPTRNEPTIDDIIRKAHTKKIYKPKVKVKGGTLSDKIRAICDKVKQNLGDVEYRLITKDEDFIDYCKKAIGCEFVSLDTETDGVDTMLVNLVGVCIKSTNQDSVYVPVGHISAITEELLDNQISKQAIHDGLQLLIDNGARFVFHNAYFDIVLLHNQVGVDIKAWFDTLIGGQLLNENEPHGLKQLYAKYCAKTNDYHKFGELFDGIPISYIPPKIAGYYGQFDTVQTEALCKFQLPYLTVGTEECKEYNLEKIAKLFWEDEMPLVEVLVGMKLTGIEFDFKQAEVLKKKYTKLRDEAEVKFNKAVEPIHGSINKYNFIHKDKPIPIPVNYNSPDQMKAIFYDICGLPYDFYRKKPGATGKEVREAILVDKNLKNKPIYKIVEALDEVKMYDKAISGFVEKLTEDAIEHGGKIYCDLKQCSTDCITADSLIATDSGYYPIGTIIDDNFGDMNIVNRYGEYESTGGCVKFTDSDTIKITTVHGFTLEGTPNHPILNDCREFVKLGDITTDDYIFIPLGYNKFPTKYHKLNKDIPYKRLYGKSLDMWNNAPDFLNEDVALLMGIYHADGSVHTSNGSYSIRIENHNEYAIAGIMEALKRVVGDNVTYTKSYNKSWNMQRSTITISGIGISWLDKYIKHGAKNKVIPKEIYTSPKSVILAYIKGLTLDSSFVDKGKRIAMSVYNKQDAYFIQSVLANIGVLAGVRFAKNRGDWFGYKVTIGYDDYNKFMCEVGCMYDYPIKVAERLRYVDAKRVDDGIYVRVKRITQGKADVYDFKVPRTHSFISNAIVSHNTGRLSCTNPNLQQCPSKLGDIRTMFKADSDCVFVNCDFSKQEPCVLASSSNDPKLIEVFHSGLDIYGKIASMMYDMPYEECLEFYPDGTTNHEGKNRRSAAKKTTLAIMYSKGVKSLSEDLHCTVEKAQSIYDSVLTAYPVMASWMEQTINKAYKDGHVDNIYGRRRRLPDLLLPKFDIDVPSDETHVVNFYKKFFTDKLNKVWKDVDVKKIKDEAREYGIFITDNRKKIAESYRKIINFCIQGSAAVITKRAMRNIYNNKRLRELGVKLVLSIHDESQCIVPKKHAYEACQIIEQCSIDAGKGLPVGLSCDLAITENWYGQEFTFDENHNLIPKPNHD